MTQTGGIHQPMQHPLHVSGAQTNTTEAWVLHNLKSNCGRPAGLQLEKFDLGPLGDEEVLVEPLYGCWEGNMGHAVARKPIDVAASRGEERAVVGNSGVVRVLKPGAHVTNVREGDVCIMCSGVWDAHGFSKYAFAYDAPGTVGILAKRTKMSHRQLIKVPTDSRFSLQQWAPFTVRYITAWSNWNAASKCWRALSPADNGEQPHVWGWGGGTAFAELTLAKLQGFCTALISSDPKRLAMIEAAGITPIDRSAFAGLQYDEMRIIADPAYAERYRLAEQRFVAIAKQGTDGRGVSIFVDHLGGNVTHATVKALARPGVITTSGWKTGMKIATNRAMACMQWQTHVHTHYSRYGEGGAAVAFAEEHGWVPPEPETVYAWDQIPQLAADYAAGSISSYFPLFKVND